MKNLKIYISLIISIFFVNQLTAQPDGGKCDFILPVEEAIYVNAIDKGLVLQENDGEITSNTTGGTTTTTTTTSTTGAANADRLIYWVHGLASNEYALDIASAYTEETYKVFGVEVEYDQMDLFAAATELMDDISTVAPIQNANNDITDPTQNFIIAKSLGGLVSRRAYKKYEESAGLYSGIPVEQRNIGGIVTFGTPHQGAQILNNSDDVYTYASETCSALGEGPALEEIENNFILDFIVSNGTVADALDATCNFLGETLLPEVFPNFELDITEDFEVGDPHIDELNNNPFPDLPQVAFYGEESEPVGLNTIHYGIVQPNTEEPFGANDESPTVDKFNSIAENYRMKYESYKELLESGDAEPFDGSCTAWQWVTSPLACSALTILGVLLDNSVGVQDATDIRDAYKRGTEWCEEFNFRYKTLIGAIEFGDVIVNNTYSCSCSIIGGSGETEINFPSYEEELQTIPSGSSVTTEQVTTPFASDCSGNNPFYDYCTSPLLISTTYTYEYEEFTSDGVVLASSAGNFPGSQYEISMGDSNHQQMNNDANLQQALANLFNGDYGQYFQTDSY